MNNSKHSYISGVALSDLSHHFGTFIIMSAKATKLDKTKRYQIRDMSKFDHQKLLQNLTNHLSTNAPNNNESVDKQFKKIFEIFSSNANTCAPFKTPLEERNDYLYNPGFHEAE